MAETATPTLGDVARLLEQGIEEQRDTRRRLDEHIEISAMRFEGLEKSLEGLRSTTNAQFLMVQSALTDINKHVLMIEDHVGFLTTKVTEHDKRFDRIDARLDGIDTRLDGIDARLDGIDARLDAHDKRFDRIDARLDGIDARLDGIDARLDGIDARLDAHDKRFDRIDARLDDLTGIIRQIRDAVITGRE